MTVTEAGFEDAKRERRTIQSVGRALDILEALSVAHGEMKLNEIAKAVGLNISTCHHLLATLAARGYVDHSPRERTYCLGNKILELSHARSRQLDLVHAAMPELRRLNADTRESVHLAVMQGANLTTLTKLDSPQPVRVGTDATGKTNAAHATATGKAILAWLPEPEIARVIAEKGFTRFTDKTIASLSDLIEELRLVRRKGYALDMEEFQPEVVCVGCAIRDHTGAVIGAISCSMPAMRASDDHMKLVTDRVIDCANGLSTKLGGTAGKETADKASAA